MRCIGPGESWGGGGGYLALVCICVVHPPPSHTYTSADWLHSLFDPLECHELPLASAVADLVLGCCAAAHSLMWLKRCADRCVHAQIVSRMCASARQRCTSLFARPIVVHAGFVLMLCMRPQLSLLTFPSPCTHTHTEGPECTRGLGCPQMDASGVEPLRSAGSDSGDSLPSELPLTDSEAAKEDGLPDELPLSPSQGLPVEAPIESGDGARSGEQDIDEEPEVASLGAEDSTHIEQVSVFARRRGRPNRPLQEALRDALGEADPCPTSDAQQGTGRHKQQVVAVGSAVVRHTSAEEARTLAKATSLTAQQVSALDKRPVVGLCPLSPLAGALDQAMELIQRCPEQHVDPTVMSLAAAVLDPERFHLASKSVLAGHSDSDRRKLSRALPLLAGALFHNCRSKRARLEAAVVHKVERGNLLMYVDFVAYDETPLPVRLVGESGAVGSNGASGELALPGQDISLLGHPGKDMAVRPLEDSWQGAKGSQKVVQTFQETGMLLKANGIFVGIIGKAICPLAVVEATSAKAIREQQLRVSPVGLGSACFSSAVRAVCTDSAASNFAAERGISQDRSSFSSLHTPCDVHKTSGVYTKSFILLDSTIRGMVSCALSLQQSSAMVRFRKALREEIASRFEIRAGPISRDAVRHKKALLHLFVSHGPALAVRQVLLVLCPNGDWRAPKVQHIVPPGQLASANREDLLERVTAGIMTALAAKQPESYPRHRWTGADIAVDRLGIIESCHKLLSTSYARFVASFEIASRAAGLLAQGARLVGETQPQVALLTLADSPEAGGFAGEAAARGEIPGVGPAQEEGNSAADGGSMWSEINTSRRRAGAEWLSTQPLAHLILLRTAMEPLRRLLANQFRVAGVEWERDQLKATLDALHRGEASWGAREYRLGIAASCADEDRFFMCLNMLFVSPELWQAMPTEGFTVKFRALTFKLLSRLGCGVLDMLKHPHEQLPYKLFELLHKPEASAELLQIPDCMWDEWSLSLRRAHPSLEGEEFLAKLSFVGHLAWKDISALESRHASVRRLVHSASVQTHRQSFPELSAQWCFLQARKAHEAARMHHGSNAQKVVSGHTWGAPLLDCLIVEIATQPLRRHK